MDIVENVSNSIINASEFINNTATTNGGGVFFNGQNCNLTYSIFINNLA